jgi:cysteine desulfurase
MKRQINWGEEIKPLFPDGSLELLVETTRGIVRDVNLDNAATTIPFSIVIEAVAEFLRTYGSVHRGSGQRSRISTQSYESARDRIQQFTGASLDSYVVFAKNTTEAINHAANLWSRIPGKVLVSDIEHSSNLLPWLAGNDVVQYRTNQDGTLNVEDVEEMFKTHGDIKLLAITGSSNVTGYKPPIHDLAELAHKYEAMILVDACQLIQHQKVDILPKDDPKHLDFVAFSGHKMYAPFGCGVLIGPKIFFDQATPYQIGGGNLTYISRNLQLKRFPNVQAHDPGTPNAVGAISIAKATGYDRIHEYELALAKTAFRVLKQINGVEVYISETELGSIIPFDIAGIDSRLTAEVLRDDYGIAVRAGSFCTYEFMRKIKNISDEQDQKISEEIDRGVTRNIPGVVRASFGLVNNQEDVRRLVSAVNEIAQNGIEHYSKMYEQNNITGTWTKR